MATTMDGSSAVFNPPMPDFSNYSLFSTAGDMKVHLQSLLDHKEKQLQQAGTLGQRVLAQQMELEERIRQLQDLELEKSDDDEVDPLARDKYRELADTLITWDTENAQLSSAFGNAKRLANGKTPSPSVPFTELPRDEHERSKASASSAAQSRRAKNAAHRADDVEFAFEIGSGLLTEVRRLQSLLAERDKAIQDMKEEKDDLEKTVETLRTALRQQEQNADKYREENWNLEVTLQEVRAQLTEYQSTAQRLEGEHKRLNKTVAQLRESSDQHKNESERLSNVIEEMKAKHETDVAQARKTAAGLNRDKADLQQVIDGLKKEVARASRRLPRFGSPLTPNGAAGSEYATPAANEDGMADVFTAASTNRKKFNADAIFGPEGEFSPELDSPEASPIRSTFLSPNHPSNEIESLQQRLAHAQRQINTLKSSLDREKRLRIEYKTKLDAASPNVTVGQASDDESEQGEGEEDDEDTAELAPASRRGGSRRGGTPFKVGASRRGRGRGGRTGITLMQRLGMAAHSPASVYNDDDQETSPPGISAIPIKFSTASEDEDNVFAAKPIAPEQDKSDSEQEDVPRQRSPSRSPSPLESPGNRTSVDGMDPAFANVLRRNGSNGSTYARSPLRQSVLGASTRGRRVVGRRARGGAAFKEVRPASIVGAPDVLSEELLGGMSDSPMRSQHILEEVEDVKEVETAEFGCQTEFEEPAPPAPEPKPETAEMAIQAKFVEEPAVVPSPPTPPAPVMLDQSMQTEEEPKVVIPVPEVATQEIQTDEEEKVITPTADMGVQHVFEEPVVPVPAAPVHADMSVGTDVQPTFDADTQTTPAKPSAEMRDLGVGMSPLSYVRDRRTTITQVNRSVSSSTGDETITGAVGRSFLAGAAESDDEEDDGDETETGVETETDTDDYTDARQSISMMTPSATESQDDFHSMMTVTDNEFPSSDEEDTQSIKASQLGRSTNGSSTSIGRSAGARPSSFYAAGGSTPSTPSIHIEYEEVGVSADFKPEPERIIETVVEKVIETVIEKVTVVEPAPKPEVREISIQTDEWKPPPAPVFTPPPTAVKPVPSSPTFARVGSAVAPQFQFIAPPPPVQATTVAPAVPTLPGPLASIFKEPPSTLTRSRTSPTDRRQSLESSLTPKEDLPLRTRVGSAATMLNVIDKSRPPVMAVPPPPKLPPPPNAMPPPSFIPERRIPTTSTGSYDGPPGRPSSPPPPELIQRATTPTFGSIRTLPGSNRPSLHFRQSGASMPPSQASQAGLHQHPSTSSFRSAANAANAQTLMSPPGRFGRRDMSQISLVSERSLHSPRSSVSSDHMYRNGRLPEPTTPGRDADGSRNLSTTDPAVIHAITQTMIGEWVYKYTRSLVKGHGSRHKRYFWIHPYTRTLYWSSADPGSSNVSESSAKSAYIENVRSVLDPNPMPPGLHQYSLIISTPQREMKITCPTQERHDIWHNALKYLLARATNPTVAAPGPNGTIRSPMSQEFTEDEKRGPMGSPQSQKSNRSIRDMGTWTATPRGQRSRSQLSVPGSIGKRSGTPALEYLRWNNVPDSPDTPSKSFFRVPSNPEERDEDEDLDFQLHGEGMSDEYEGLENVRACCDGRHTVGPSSKHHHHHHTHTHTHQHNQHLDTAREAAVPTRPLSPSTWSFRSRSGSTHSQEGSGGIFSWGRNEDGKRRFGSRRSTRTPIPTTDQ